MNRRTLFKGLAALPLLKYLHVDFSTEAEPSWKMVLAEEGVKTGDGRESLIARGGMCAPMCPTYTLVNDRHRPVMDALPVFTVPRGGIRFIKPE